MAVFRYKQNEQTQEFPFPLPESAAITIDTDEPPIRIGSARDNNLVFPDTDPLHAVIVRSSGAWVLIDKSRGNTFINNARVVVLQVLKHGNTVRFGRAEVEYAEIMIVKLKRKDNAIGTVCPICSKRFREEDEVVFCPSCRTPHHRDCWFDSETCAKKEYPTVPFEYLDNSSRLLNKECACGKVFSRGNRIVYCPECKTPYHSEKTCWFGRKACAECGFVRMQE